MYYLEGIKLGGTKFDLIFVIALCSEKKIRE